MNKLPELLEVCGRTYIENDEKRFQLTPKDELISRLTIVDSMTISYVLDWHTGRSSALYLDADFCEFITATSFESEKSCLT